MCGKLGNQSIKALTQQYKTQDMRIKARGVTYLKYLVQGKFCNFRFDLAHAKENPNSEMFW